MNPFNITYSDWTKSWQWAYSIPKDHHPAYDNTGEFCWEKQKILYGSSQILLDIWSHVIVISQLVMLYFFPF